MGSNSSLNTVNWCATVAVAAAAATAAAICSAYISFAHILLARKTSERNEVKTHENQRVSLKLSHIRLVLCWFDFIAFCFTFVWKRFSATSLFFEFYIQDTFFFFLNGVGCKQDNINTLLQIQKKRMKRNDASFTAEAPIFSLVPEIWQYILMNRLSGLPH